MSTAMLLPVLERMDQAGFTSMEIIASAFFKKLVRELRDDPWERIRLARQRAPRTPLRAIRSRYMAGFQITPQVISALWVERLAANGVREVRGSCPSNTPANWVWMVDEARRAGIGHVLNITYSVSPKHTDAYYAERVAAGAKLPVKRIVLKDPGGILTPERTTTLARVFIDNAGDIPVELHAHCNAGFGPLCCMAAVKAGIRYVNTGIPPLANASALPNVYSVATNLQALGFAPQVDVEGLRPVTEHFTTVAKQHSFPLGVPNDYDEFLYRHQVPGGMISNLKHQLGQVGAGHRLTEVLEETARVRAELGYPIMVTPYSQFVGVQATINVLLGDRYKEVTDQVIEYALGHWGEEERVDIQPDIRDKILNRPRARELARWQPPDLTLKEFRAQLGGPGVSDDDLLLRYFAGAADVALMREKGPRDRAVDTDQPLALLMDRLSQPSSFTQIFIQKGNFTLHLTRPEGRPGAQEA